MQRKQGFTLIEFVVGLTVLSLGALILATFIRASLNLQLASKEERDANAQVNQSLNEGSQSNIDSVVTFTTTDGASLLPAEYHISGKVAKADSLIHTQFLLSVQPYWIGNNLLHLYNEPKEKPTQTISDPLCLSPLNLTNLSSSTLSNDLTFNETDAWIWLSGGEYTTRSTLILSQEVVILSNDSGNLTIGSSSHIVFNPKSNAFANQQPTLLYAVNDITIDFSGHSATLSKGWYAILPGYDLQDLINNQSSWRLDYMRYSTDITSLTQEQSKTLADELDQAYARVCLAGLTF